MKGRWTKAVALVVTMAILFSGLISCAPEAPEEPTEVTTEVTVETETEITREVVVTATPESAETEPGAETGGRGTCGTLRLLWWQAPSILNPHLATGSKDQDAATPIYEPLAHFDENGEIDLRYGLAAEVPTRENGGISSDGRSITWKLKEGIQWSDGTLFTADDVVFTWQYIADPDAATTSAGQMGGVEIVEKIDEYTVKVTFEEPTPVPFTPYIGRFGLIFPKHVFQDFMGEKAQDAPANYEPVGTGPYVVREFRPDDVVVYEPNPYYRDPDKPCFEEVILQGGGDATSAARAVLVTGDADYAWNLQVSADVLADLNQGGQGTLTGPFGGNVERMIINFANPAPELGDERAEPGNPHPFLTDLKVRQALALGVDRQAIVDTLYGGGTLGKVACNILAAPPSLVSSTEHETCEYDLEEANRLLDEAGWTRGSNGIRQKVVDGETVEMNILFQTSVNQVRQKTQEIVKQGWEELGIDVELKAIKGGVFFSSDPANPDTYRKFYADIEMFGNGPSFPDDPSYLGGFTCDEIKTREQNWTGANIGRWCNPDYDELFSQLQETFDPDERAELYKRMNDMVVDQVVVVPLVEKAYPVTATSKDLGGVVMNPWALDLWNIADWYR